MKLTKTNLQKLKKEATPLQKNTINYVLDKWEDYNSKTDIFTDVLYYGCEAGTVGYLIYYDDIKAFYKKYKKDIQDLLYELMDETGEHNIANLFNRPREEEKWDVNDPFANDVQNQNLLAWFGFEEALRSVGRNFEELEDLI